MTQTEHNPQSGPPGLGPLFGELQKNWGWLLALGVLSIALGTFGLGMTFLLTEFVMEFFGALLVVGGVFQALNTARCRGWKSALWNVLIALLYVAAGLLIFLKPLVTAVSLTLLLGLSFIAVGIFRAFMAFQLRPVAGWYWSLVAGLVSVALGAIILAEWPQSGHWVIGLFIAIELIFHGWSYVFIALAARQAGRP